MPRIPILLFSFRPLREGEIGHFFKLPVFGIGFRVPKELRRARKLTPVRLAKALGISQDGVSRLEKRSDLLLSTMRKSVEAMGGNLSLVAEFPDRKPVILSGIATVESDPA